jgi:hypothetical protein
LDPLSTDHLESREEELNHSEDWPINGRTSRSGYGQKSYLRM